ncbi:MurR/RpiR family transcriptional regulator [Sciscionella sediminilitoris]|uniref:MurR/RpiR family transcriptional regulator n=1 Tax=Sciscionella sediminilitoris TaxID=1445613 RepID=UPI0004DFB60C|nr:MurR/RpiR family transcriptional regulator [Sciscionella sp. SE31]
MAVSRQPRTGASTPSRALHELLAGRTLTPAQRRIAQYLLANIGEAAALTSGELAERAGVSQPSVTRFVSLLGFDGFPQFRRAMRGFLEAAEPAEEGNKLQLGVREDIARLETLHAELAGQERLAGIAERLYASVPLVVSGLRVSAHVAGLFGYLAAKIHPDVRVLTNGGTVLLDQLGHARAAGASEAVFFAMPRYPRETAAAMRFAGELGMRVVLITDEPVSAITEHAGDVLHVGVGSELVFDSHAAIVSLSVALLETIADAAGPRARQRLEGFDRYAAEQEIFTER